jgi:hypothetical protein
MDDKVKLKAMKQFPCSNYFRMVKHRFRQPVISGERDALFNFVRDQSDRQIAQSITLIICTVNLFLINDPRI